MGNYYLAVDIGASSGRHILAHLENGKILLEEIHRFPNQMEKKNGHLVWDTDRLFQEIKTGLKKCAALGKIPVSMGIDTWAVDFVLLDHDGKRIGEPAAYRDSRTDGMDREVYRTISEEALYARTGIQKQKFNTIYQLMALQKQHPDELARADCLLMIPDYFHYLLTGNAVAEYTNATTTQLVSPETREWDMDLIEALGYPRRIFRPIAAPGTAIGHFKKEIREEIGFDCSVVLPATHDTASAVAAVPAVGENILYVSSGTWSLMGTEQRRADCSEESRKHNFTNEGGYEYRFRYLKNIMGLWMIQSVKKEIGGELDYGEICRLAAGTSITSILDCNDGRFLAPANMTAEVAAACRESDQQVPEGIGETAAVIYNSLAKCYCAALGEIEQFTGKTYSGIYIVGGGANADYLNRLTAEKTGIPVYAGPVEATSVGNAVVQMIAGGEIRDLSAARGCIRESFPIRVYHP